ncbi:class I SAM-dependent methyltransferase [Leminorella grimontii]|uniref:class I SAM-dependent methyltransferase n=1 Tax=Leminorella grimontii TaxID=82981 RepID=UPI00207F3D1D|nr:class I SAM-dependent methyltransferase [Leminorella grimontii]GKX61284.1 methyltransferase [Leminorella grimontii]
MNRPILDMCCGSRMFWFNKQDERAVFSDIRKEHHTLCDGRQLDINPDVIADFRNLPFDDEQFSLVIFDPPHLSRCGPNGWQGKKYGVLNKKTWRDDLRAGFSEGFRVLRPHGTLIFKWNEVQIPLKEILALTDQKPAIGHLSGKRSDTHWISFLKESNQ